MSLYISHPSANPTRIHAYPKRRRMNIERLAWKTPGEPAPRTSSAEACYADFFVTQTAEMASA
jgi:hypothetical protein